jgi:ribosome-binding protein aMBF1 (putative translation factor)
MMLAAIRRLSAEQIDAGTRLIALRQLSNTTYRVNLRGLYGRCAQSAVRARCVGRHAAIPQQPRAGLSRGESKMSARISNNAEHQKTKIGLRMLRARRWLRMSQARLGELAGGYSRNMVARWEVHGIDPSHEAIPKLEAALGVRLRSRDEASDPARRPESRAGP